MGRWGELDGAGVGGWEGGSLQSAAFLRPPGGMPARLRGNVSCECFGGLGRRDLLVVAIAWLAYGAGAADDDVV